MEAWQIVLLVFIVGAAGAGLYGLHRLCLWLEDRGLMYYLRKKPTSSPASCFVALQQAVEPSAKHVLHLRDERRDHAEDESPGADTAAQRDSPLPEHQ